jgi:flagellar L-ring protein precursor FlgH
MRCTLPTSIGFFFLQLVILGSSVVPAASKTKSTPQELRNAYVNSLQQASTAQAESRTLGSLWSPGAPMGNLSADIRARNLNDTITIVVAELTSAQSSGNVTSQRTFATQSGITGLLAQIPTQNVDPLLGANSSTQLKGQGQTAAGLQLTTRLTGRVVALLPNGNLVVEAERQVYMNNQRETMIVRGVVQPSDITANNSVLSTALANLQIEMKGKGIISDSTRPPNPITRAILWLFGF